MALPPPKVGDSILLELPNERTTGVVRKVLNKGKNIYAQITKATMPTFHPFKEGDWLGFKREISAMNGDTKWVVDRTMQHIRSDTSAVEKKQAIGD